MRVDGHKLLLYRPDSYKLSSTLKVLYSNRKVHLSGFALQHLQDILDVSMSALDWMMKAYPEVKEREDMRRIVGRYGLTGMQQVGVSTIWNAFFFLNYLKQAETFT